MVKDNFGRAYLEALPEVCLVALRVEPTVAKQLLELRQLLRYRTTVFAKASVLHDSPVNKLGGASQAIKGGGSP